MTDTWPWPAPVDDGGAAHLTPGTRLPAIALPLTTGGVLDLVTRPGRTLVFVYTWTGRPGLDNPRDWDTIPGAHGSTPQAQGFAALHDAYARIGTGIVGLSTQDTNWQSEFAARLALPFPLASDHRLEWADALRLPRFETGGQTILRRLTILACDGRIERVWYPVHPPDRHPRDVLAWLDVHCG